MAQSAMQAQHSSTIRPGHSVGRTQELYMRSLRQTAWAFGAASISPTSFLRSSPDPGRVSSNRTVSRCRPDWRPRVRGDPPGEVQKTPSPHRRPCHMRPSTSACNFQAGCSSWRRTVRVTPGRRPRSRPAHPLDSPARARANAAAPGGCVACSSADRAGSPASGHLTQPQRRPLTSDAVEQSTRRGEVKQRAFSAETATPGASLPPLRQTGQSAI